MRAWLRAMTAVCGIGRPSGRRNSATTANQSASAPTMAASAMAFTQLSSRPRSTTLVAMNTAVTSSNSPSACRLARRRATVALSVSGFIRASPPTKTPMRQAAAAIWSSAFDR